MSSSAEPPGTVAEPPAKEMSPWAPLALAVGEPVVRHAIQPEPA